MAAPIEGVPHAERLRFQDFTFERLPTGKCRARVVLTWADGREFVGDSEEVVSQAGELRCSAGAVAQALGRATRPQLGFEVLGVKAVRAFDATVVIVSLSARWGTGTSRLVGSCITDKDPPRAAALAVLSATNRILGNFYFAR